MSYNDYENSENLYSDIPEDCRDERGDKIDKELELPPVSTDFQTLKRMVVSNIFPEASHGLRMRMVNLSNGCAVIAEPASEYCMDELISEMSQIDPFVEIMLQAGDPFVIGNQRTKNCVRISIVDPRKARPNISRTLTRKRVVRLNRMPDHTANK